MGDARKDALRVEFDRRIKLEFHGATVTSDAGLVAYRELDEALELTQMSKVFRESRQGKNTQHELIGLLRQSVYSRLAGYEDTNDAERHAVDPATRQVIGSRARDYQTASTSQMSRFETEVLTTRKNRKSLMDLPGMWIDRVHQHRSLDKLILDLDSSVSETYGRQEGSAYNGYFACNCYHPLFCFNHLGDLERVLLRNGNAASADHWLAILEPVVARYRHLEISKYFRGDAAFAIPELYSFLEEEDYGYAIRLKSNAVLERHIQHLLTRPVGRPPKKPVARYHQFMYQAGTWDRERRVVAKVEWHQGELFPRIGFIVTNLSWQCKRVVRHYNQRGTAEQSIREGKNAVEWTKLSCHDFVDNHVRLQLFALAYNLGNFLRRLYRAILERIRRFAEMSIRPAPT